jgi:hypothetical protein
VSTSMLRGCHHLHKIGCPNRQHLDRKARRTYLCLMILKGPDVQHRRGLCCGRRCFQRDPIRNLSATLTIRVLFRGRNLQSGARAWNGVE